jgi:hypothetical protein
MNAMLVRKAGSGLSELSPFQLEQDPKDAAPPRLRFPEAGYGCVEWFHYLEHSSTPPANAEIFPRQPGP